MRTHLLSLRCLDDISTPSQIWFQDIFHQTRLFFFLGAVGVCGGDNVVSTQRLGNGGK